MSGPAAVIVNESGTNIAQVKDSSTAAVAADKALVVAVSPNNSIAVTDGGGSLTVDGPLTDAQLRATAVPVADGGGSLTVDGSVSVSNFPAVQPVSDNGGSLTVDNANLDVALSTRATEATALTLLTQANFNARIGEVQATPTANTVLGRLKDLFDAIVARLGTLGQKAMASSTPVVIANDQSSVNVQLTDAAGVKLGVDDAILIPAGTDGILAMGTDYTGFARRIRTTDDGRLVVNSAVSAPPNNTAVNVAEVSSMTGTQNSFYTIPNGEQLKIQRFSGGSEVATDGNKVELYWAPNGNTTGIVLVRVGYVSGSNFEYGLDYNAPELGNGTRAILLRRVRLGGGSAEIAGFWDGYY